MVSALPVIALVLTIAASGAAAACGQPGTGRGAAPTADPSRSPATTDPAGHSPAANAPTAQPQPAPTAEPPPSGFSAAVTPLPAPVVGEMTGVSWRPGCPLGLSQLRLVRLVYWGLDGTAHRGELVTHTDLAQAMVRVFGKLYDARFPIGSMLRVDAFGGDDHASMAADNTSMFNCRRAEGSTSWSRHAYGRAIDINTVENPYVRGSTILPPAGAAYLDRSNVRAGMIVGGDVVVRAFAAEGFRWGGNYTGLKDYQHFEKLA